MGDQSFINKVDASEFGNEIIGESEGIWIKTASDGSKS